MNLQTRKWRPEKGEKYWLCDCQCPNVWDNSKWDNHLLKEGMVYATKELAMRASVELERFRQMLPKAPPSPYPTQKYQRRSDDPRAFKELSPTACAYWLNEEQAWRRGERFESPLSPKELGNLIDRVIQHLLYADNNSPAAT